MNLLSAKAPNWTVRSAREAGVPITLIYGYYREVPSTEPYHKMVVYSMFMADIVFKSIDGRSFKVVKNRFTTLEDHPLLLNEFESCGLRFEFDSDRITFDEPSSAYLRMAAQ